jgi:hypothetical protein
MPLDEEVFLKGAPFATAKYKALGSTVLQMSEIVYLMNCYYTSLVTSVSRDINFTFRIMCRL